MQLNVLDDLAEAMKALDGKNPFFYFFFHKQEADNTHPTDVFVPFKRESTRSRETNVDTLKLRTTQFTPVQTILVRPK